MRRLLVSTIALGLLLLGAACGGSDGSGSGGGGVGGGSGSDEAVEACDLTSPDTVADVFGGTVESEEPGTARNCSYAVEGGATESVQVYSFGTSDGWDGIRSGYEDNRGPLTDVAGVGEEAFHPGDTKENEIVVRSGGQVFAVGIGTPGTTPVPEVRELAERIADDLG